MRCKHKWEMIDKTILVHPLVDMMRRGGEYQGAWFEMEDRVIYVFQCGLCSEIKIEER